MIMDSVTEAEYIKAFYIFGLPSLPPLSSIHHLSVPLTSHNKVKRVVSFENSSRSPFLLPRLCDHSSRKNVEK